MTFVLAVASEAFPLVKTGGLADVGRSARLKNVVIDRGVRIPERLVVGEDPALDAARFRRTDKGVCLITQAMVDRL